MDEEDEIALKLINARLPQPISEDVFEEVMSFFEETASNKQPFAAVDSPPVLTLEEIEDRYDDTVSTGVRKHGKLVYSYWRTRRSQNNNDLIQPHLKVSIQVRLDKRDTNKYSERARSRL